MTLRHHLAIRICGIAAASLLALPAPALADVRDTDAICGLTQGEEARLAEDRPDIQARAAIVVDDDGTVYFERDADEEVKIASLTKVMTAILAIENADMDDELTVGHRAATVGQSTAELEEGDVLTMEEALRGLMIPSGNDAAMAIAEHVGAIIEPGSSDPYAAFIKAMNDKAAELGMDHTVFTNPHGLDFDGWEGDFHSTARDVATMFSHAMKSDRFRALTASPDNKITVTSADGSEREIDMIERNEILGREGNIGGKTGGTYDADSCFVGAFSRETGGEVYTVTLGSEDGEQRWADTLALANWYYDHVVAYPLGKSTRSTADGRGLVARAPHADWTDKSIDVVLSDPDQTAEVFSLAGDVEVEWRLDELHGKISEGDAVGSLALVQNGEELAQGELLSAESQDAPGGIDWLMVRLDRLVRLVTGQPRTAEEAHFVETPSPRELDRA